jgi:hypothetical protein
LAQTGEQTKEAHNSRAIDSFFTPFPPVGLRAWANKETHAVKRLHCTSRLGFNFSYSAAELARQCSDVPYRRIDLAVPIRFSLRRPARRYARLVEKANRKVLPGPNFAQAAFTLIDLIWFALPLQAAIEILEKFGFVLPK